MSDHDPIVVCVALRTPICRAKRGAFAKTTPDHLLATVLRAVVDRSGIDAASLGDIVVGNVLDPGGGAAMSRMAQLMAGIPHTVPLSKSIDCVAPSCLSPLVTLSPPPA